MSVKFFWVLLSFFVAANGAYAQVVGGAISGIVRDPAGAPLAGAAVRVLQVETGAERKLVTDDGGHFSAPSIAVGPYRVTAAREGFATQEKTNIEVLVGQHVTVDFLLTLGELKQIVTVEESASPVTLATQQTTGVVNERQVKELPLNGRSYDGLLALNPSIVNYSAQRSGGVGTSNSAVGNMFAVAGRRPQDNLFLLNGIEYTGASLINNTPGGTSGQLLGVEAVREFNVVTGAYGAEYGKRPGAQVSIVTASGSNQLHGSLYEFIRNSKLDARNFFDQGSTPQFQRNVFGGALGGPVKKDKLFLFGNYEGYRQHLALSNVTLVPDDAARRSASSPTVARLLTLWPVANGPELGGGIAIAYNNPLQRIGEDFGTVRGDYNFSEKDTLFAVYTVDDSYANTPTVNPLSTVFETLREQVGSVQEQHVFSPTVLNTTRLGFSRASYYFTGSVPVDGIPGWTPGAPIGALVIGGGTALNGASQISLAGANAGSNLSAVRNLFTFDDHASWSHGKHQFEAGVWLQRVQANDNLAQYQYGQASFSSLQSFLQGQIATFSLVPHPTPLGWRSVEGAGFVQDSIKLRSNLELKLGFRFESVNGWNEVHGRASNYLFDASGVIQTEPRVGTSVFTKNRAKFMPEPRAGIAWDPTGKSKTVVYAGFGIYRALLDNLDYRLDQTAPFNTTQAIKNVQIGSIVAGAPLPPGGLISPSGVQSDVYTPTILSYTFRIDQQVAAGTRLSLGYVGSRGYHLMLSVDANEPVAQVGANGDVFYPKNAPLANAALANTTTWFSEGVSSYNALQLDVSRRLQHGLQFRGVYTWSKSLDDGTALNSSVAANAPGFVMYPLDPKRDWSLSTTDIRHLATVQATYELPFSGRLRGGWAVSAIQTLQTGLPFTAQLGYNPTGNGDSRNPIRPSVNPAFTGTLITGNPNHYFDANAFVNPATGTYGNLGRNTLTGPGMATLDFSALKRLAISERVKLQFRAEFFNILNHTNFSTPNAVVFTSSSNTPAPTAGVITATAGTSRQIQFGVKVLF